MDYILSIVSISVYILAGQKYWQAWVLGIFNQFLWAGYSIYTGQVGFLISAFGFLIVNTINLRKWLKDPPRKQVEETPCACKTHTGV